MSGATPDVVVVGGGAVGCAIARELARAGARVTVLERGRPGGDATSASAGMLVPLVEAGGGAALLPLLRAAIDRFAGLAVALREETGIDIAYRAVGALHAAFTPDDEHELATLFVQQRAAGFAPEWLAGDEARRLEPALAEAVRAAVRFPDHHQVENRALGPALWAGAARAGARMRAGVEVAGLKRAGGRVAGVALDGGERVPAGAVVLAGGCWSGRLQGLPRRVPVEPVHGQLVAVEALPPPFEHVLFSPRGYLVPRSSGRIILGATIERFGFRKITTPAGVLQILQNALALVPQLATLPIVETWSGLRPGTPDGLPILGADPEVAGLFYATGHFRNGILLAPLTGELLAQLVRTGRSDFDLRPFAIERFG